MPSTLAMWRGQGRLLVVAPVFTDQELESLRRFPEIGRRNCSGSSPLPPADSAFIDRGREPEDRHGLAVAVWTLPWLGFVPDDVASAAPAAVARLAEQFWVDPEEVRSYGVGRRPGRIICNWRRSI
jgi:hypothetical protein